MTGGDTPRRRRDDGAEEAARDDSVPMGEAAPAVGGGLMVLRPETGARGAAVGASERGEMKRARGAEEFGRWGVALF
jgi:hypothetical protein